jgi:hypothetical protein
MCWVWHTGAVADQPQFSVRLPDGREFGPGAIEVICQWAREGRIPIDAVLVPADGSAVRSVLAEPALRVILQAPPTIQGELQQPAVADDGAMSGLIPYRNPPALVGYYFSVAALLPFIGAIPALIAVILGFIGLRKRLKEPRVRGLAHAWVAIILGLICAIGWTLLFVVMIVAAGR